MEPHPPERPEVELLEPDPPGSLERFATTMWHRRAVRATAAVAALAAAGALAFGFGFADEALDPAAPAAADDVMAAEPLTDDDRVPPPWVTSSGRPGWQVVGEPRFNHRSPVYVVTFVVANRSAEPRSPGRLRAVGRFVGGPGFRFSASCAGFDNDARGELRPVRSPVEPGERVLVRCTDEMEYSGNRPRLVRSSLGIEEVPCEGGGRRPQVS